MKLKSNFLQGTILALFLVASVVGYAQCVVKFRVSATNEAYGADAFLYGTGVAFPPVGAFIGWIPLSSHENMEQ